MSQLRYACLLLAAAIAGCPGPDPPLLSHASTFLGGMGTDKVMDVAVGPTGGVYVIGYTASAAFPQQWPPGGWDSEFEDGSGTGGQLDGFVVRLTSDLKEVTAWTFLGGRNLERVFGLAIDSSGNVFVAGQTRSVQGPWNPEQGEYGGQFLWPPHDPDPSLPKAFDERHSPNLPKCALDDPSGEEEFDAFVVKLSSHLDTLLAWTYLGGNLNDSAEDIVLSPDGETVYVVGSSKCHCQEDEFCNGTDLYKTAARRAHSDVVKNDDTFNNDAVLWVLDGNLDLKAYTFLGGRGEEVAYGAVWKEQTEEMFRGVFVAGFTRSDDFPSPPDGDSAKGGSDAFVVRFSDDAIMEDWTLVGGPDWDHSDGAIDFDPSTGVVIAIDTGPGGDQCAAHDVWILQLDESLGTKQTPQYLLGSNKIDQAWDLEVSDGYVWVGGYTRPQDCDRCRQTAPEKACPPHEKRCFGAMPGQAGDECATIFKEEARNSSWGLPPPAGGGSEGFLSVLSDELTTSCSRYVGSAYADEVMGLATDGELGVYLAGLTALANGKSDFPTTPGALQPEPGGGSYDGFVTWLGPSSWSCSPN